MPDDGVEMLVDQVLQGPAFATRDEPPYSIRFVMRRGKQWPALQFTVLVEDQPVLSLTTEEPRLKRALQAILTELE